MVTVNLIKFLCGIYLWEFVRVCFRGDLYHLYAIVVDIL